MCGGCVRGSHWCLWRKAQPRLLLCKQKTAYEVRISDWSSDVCSSDREVGVGPAALLGTHRGRRMDSIGGARIAVDQIGFAPIASLEDELRALRDRKSVV